MTITMERRSLVLRQLAGELRTAVFEDREHLVVPVVLLMEGVIHPVNADTPELVLASELAVMPGAWNGEPVLWDHPIVGGMRVSANDPRVLEQWAFGKLFNVHMDGKKLVGEAWLDTTRALEMGGHAQDVVVRANAGEMIEVSVGAFIVAESVEGNHNGKIFKKVWRQIGPDHLAMLPEGTTGACSNEMGCGAPRAAQLVVNVTHDGLEPVDVSDAVAARHDEGSVANLGTPETTTEGQTSMTDIKRRVADALTTLTERFRGRMVFKNSQGDEEMSDSELRTILDRALFASEPGYLGIEAVFPGESTVVYAVAPDDELTWLSREYNIADDTNDVTFGESTEVKPVTRFEPVNAVAAPCGCDDPAACECGNEPGVLDMEKAERIKALIDNESTPYCVDDQAALEAMSDTTLDALEASATEEPAPDPAPVVEEPVEPDDDEPVVDEPAQAAAKPMSREDWMAAAPADIRQSLQKQLDADQAEKDAVIAILVGAQDAYTEKELGAMEMGELTKLAKIANAEAPAADYSLRAMPRAASNDDGIPDAPDLVASVKAAEAKRVN